MRRAFTKIAVYEEEEDDYDDEDLRMNFLQSNAMIPPRGRGSRGGRGPIRKRGSGRVSNLW